MASDEGAAVLGVARQGGGGLTGKRIEAFGGSGSGGGVGGLFGLAEMIARGGPIVHGFESGVESAVRAAILGVARQGVRWLRRGWPGRGTVRFG